MKFGVPWSVKGIRPEARETAEAAARRAGMPLGEWLNSVIIQQAEQEGAQSPPLAAHDSQGGDLATVNHRLDDLSRRVEQLARTGPAAYAPKRSRNKPDPLKEQMVRVGRRLDEFASVPPPAMPSVQLPPSLDRAVAEIAARQRMLNGNAAPAPRQQSQAAMAARPPAPLPLSLIHISEPTRPY